MHLERESVKCKKLLNEGQIYEIEFKKQVNANYTKMLQYAVI
jgi:hypothetical protein